MSTGSAAIVGSDGPGCLGREVEIMKVMSSIDISIRRRVLVRAGTGALALGAIVWTSVAGAASGGSGIADLVEQVVRRQRL